MLEQLRPDTRSRMAASLARAMSGRQEATPQKLNHLSADAPEAVAIAMAQALVLHLDGENAQALEVFDMHIIPNIDEVPLVTRTVVAANRNTIRFAMRDFTAAADHYKTQDLIETVSTPAGEASDVLRAHDAAAQNRHRDALPLYWGSLLDAYADGTWSRVWAAHGRMARECCALGWVAEAVFHAVASLDEETVKLVAAAVIDRNSSATILEGFQSAMSCSHLLRHRVMASAFIEQLRDLVPENVFDTLFDWAIQGARREPRSLEESEGVAASWKTLSAIALQASEAQATLAVELAIVHPLYRTPSFHRRIIIRLLRAFFPKLSLELMTLVADSCADLLSVRRHDVDYDDALNLAATIVEKGQPELVRRFGEIILPPKSPLPDPRLARLVPMLGRQPAQDSIARIVLGVASGIRCQVQRVKTGESTSFTLSSFGTLEHRSADENIVVQIHGGAVEVDMILASRNWLSPDQIHTLIDAFLEMVDDPFNLASNKVSLIHAVSRLCENVDVSRSLSVIEKLEPHALGDSPSVWEDQGHLSQIHLHTEDSVDVAGWALYCIATAARAHFDSLGPRVTPAVEKALRAADPRTRTAAATALGEFPTLTQVQTSDLIACTRDAETKVAIAAYRVLWNRRGVMSDDTQWQFLANSIWAAFGLKEPSVRRSAAYCIRCLCRPGLSEAQRHFVDELTARARGDLFASVRRAIVIETTGAQN